MFSFSIRLIPVLQTPVLVLTSVHVEIFNMWNSLRYVLKIKFTSATFVFSSLLFCYGVPLKANKVCLFLTGSENRDFWRYSFLFVNGPQSLPDVLTVFGSLMSLFT